MQLRTKLATFNEKIAGARQSIQELTQRRDSVNGQTAPEQAEGILEQLKAAERQLESLQLLRMAVEKKLNEYANNRLKASKVLHEITPLWRELMAEAKKIIDARNAILEGLEKAQSIEKQIRALVNQHFVLVGEWAYAPNTAFWPTRQHYERLAHQLRNEDLAFLPRPWEET